MQQNSKHIVLGAGGAIGTALTKELISSRQPVKLISRKGVPVESAESVQGDLLNYISVLNAIDLNSTVYLVAGLAYEAAVWKKQWPVIMKNTIDACKEKKARLIFFDNVYMYGRVQGPMTEETPVNPCSTKGEIRATIAEMLLREIRNRNITGMIARSADFYGPYAVNSSIPNMFVIKNLLQGKKAVWFADPKTKHSYTNTIDCGEALFLLSQRDDAYNQVWHLPTASPPITGEEFIIVTADLLDRDPGYKVLNKFMFRMAGLFNKTAREAAEMLYQNEYDYLFDSTKFNRYFTYTPRGYKAGIKETIDYFRSAQ